MKKKNKNKKWIKLRHRIVRNIAYAIIYPYSKIKYGLKIERFREEKRRQYLILYNHQTAFDQFFVGMTTKETVYYVASEDLFSNGFVSKLISHLVAPIPIKKQSTDVRAVLNCMKVAKEGGSIAIAPEGNRTFSGVTGYMNPAIAPLARKLGLTILFCKIEGGYGVHPRWSDKVRHGKMSARIVSVLEPEAYSQMSDDELFAHIKKELFVDESTGGVFRHQKRAEYLERAIYYCPKCGFSRFGSKRDRIKCLGCGMELVYTETKELVGVNCESPFKTVYEWYKKQGDFVLSMNPEEYIEKPLYIDSADVYSVELYKRKTPFAKSAVLSLYGNRIEISVNGETRTLPFNEIGAVAILGKNKLNIYLGQNIYQIKSDKRFCALKYLNVFYRAKSVAKGDLNGEFLGI